MFPECGLPALHSIFSCEYTVSGLSFPFHHISSVPEEVKVPKMSSKNHQCLTTR